MAAPARALLSPDPPPEDGLLWRITLATLTAVALVGVCAALIGGELTVLKLRDRIERRASLLAVSTAARMQGLPAPHRALLAQELTDAVGSVVTVLEPDGSIAPNAPRAPVTRELPSSLRAAPHAGVVLPDEGWVVAVETLAPEGDDPRPPRVAVFTPLPSEATRRGALALLFVKLLAVLAATGAAGGVVSFVVARDIALDVRAITASALRMLTRKTEALRPLPVRARDEVGALVVAFNRLQKRFADEVALHRQALERLDENERRRETLINTLRHELRTPLNSILGFAQLLLQEVDGALSPEQREDVELIARSGAHLLRLVDDVLDLSAMASGRYAIAREPVDLVTLARDVVEEARGIARTRGVTLAMAGLAEAPSYGDPVALRRAFTNLVVNAIEHAGGEVTVTVAERGRGFAVSVRDNGRGISSRELRRLFKPFERGRTAEARGAGLGLAITLGLVELHGGTLSANSEEGRGSTFTATIPAGMAPLAPTGEG
jgi:signal transduction histidine kinase